MSSSVTEEYQLPFSEEFVLGERTLFEIVEFAGTEFQPAELHIDVNAPGIFSISSIDCDKTGKFLPCLPTDLEVDAYNWRERKRIPMPLLLTDTHVKIVGEYTGAIPEGKVEGEKIYFCAYFYGYAKVPRG